MTTNYPSSLDTVSELKNNSSDATVSAVTHKSAHNNASDAIIAIETELGAQPSAGYSTVAERMGDMAMLSPGADQVITSGGAAVVPLALRLHASQSTVRPLELQASGGAILGYWNLSGIISGVSVRINNAALASSHLSDAGDLLLNPSPSITSPTMSSPSLTGTPVAPTAAVDTSTTQVATTAFVKNQGYIVPASPALTGTPTAPTQAVGNNSTRVATTAFVIAEIASEASAGTPVGTIAAWGNATPPTGWLLCDGAAVSQATYADLYAAIGLGYGNPGGGNFNLPDLRGRSPVGKGTHADMSVLGYNEGSALADRRPKHPHSGTLSTSGDGGHGHSLSGTSSTGSHSHSLTGSSGSTVAPAGSDNSVGSSSGQSTSGSGGHSHSMDTSGAAGHTHSVSGAIGTTGMTDLPAYAVAYYIIRHAA